MTVLSEVSDEMNFSAAEDEAEVSEYMTATRPTARLMQVQASRTANTKKVLSMRERRFHQGT